MKIIIAGSRTVTESAVRHALRCYSWLGFVSAVVSGTARGADSYGEKWAMENGIDVIRFPADWEKYGKFAGPMRNKQMAEHADGLIAIWDGKSRGTQSMIELGNQHGLRIGILRTDTGIYEEYQADGASAAVWAIAEERACIKEFDGGLSRTAAEREAGEQAARRKKL